jgi:hypothetical protein
MAIVKKGKKVELEGFESSPMFETKEDAVTYANVESTQMEMVGNEFVLCEVVEVKRI